MTVTREQIAAFADGELMGQARDEVEAAIAADPALAAQVEAHRKLKARLAAHYAPVLDWAVPDALHAIVAGAGEGAETSAEVIDLNAMRARRDGRARPRWAWGAAAALAASLTLAVVLTRPHAPGADYASGDLKVALNDQLAASQPDDATTRILLSFRNHRGEFCRGFAGAAQSGIACRDARGWRLDRVGGGAGQEQGQYRMAGSTDPGLMARIQDMADGPALDAAGEAAAKARDWRK